MLANAPTSGRGLLAKQAQVEEDLMSPERTRGNHEYDLILFNLAAVSFEDV